MMEHSLAKISNLLTGLALGHNQGLQPLSTVLLRCFLINVFAHLDRPVFIDRNIRTVDAALNRYLAGGHYTPSSLPGGDELLEGNAGHE